MCARTWIAWGVVLFLAGVVSACGSPASLSGPVPVTGAEPTATFSFGLKYETMDPARFGRPAQIDNRWFPLTPGTQMIYEGTTVEDGETIPHQIVFTVTDLTKRIGGTRTVVVWDRDFSGGDLVEAELAFYAQDDDGAVWHLGQYPEEYDQGQVSAAPSWIQGIQDARAGIAMLADPQPGTRDYSQGWGPAVDWTDRARVEQTGQKVCVVFRCFEDVLVIKETSASEQGAYQVKYYAPGVGNIKTGWEGKDLSQETLELVQVVRLDAQALAEVRAEALKLEKSAYALSKDVYDLTAPINPN